MVIFRFPPARPRKYLDTRGGDLRLTDIGHNSLWHMKCAQHAADNPKFE